MIVVIPAWQRQPWHPLLLEMSTQCPLLLTRLPDLLLDPHGNKHPFLKVTRNPLIWKEFQSIQPSLRPSQEDWVLLQVQIGLE